MLDHGHFEHCDDRASPERHRRLQPWRPTPSVLNAPSWYRLTTPPASDLGWLRPTPVRTTGGRRAPRRTRHELAADRGGTDGEARCDGAWWRMVDHDDQQPTATAGT